MVGEWREGKGGVIKRVCVRKHEKGGREGERERKREREKGRETQN